MLAIYWDSTQAEITFIYQMVCQQVINQRVFCSFIKQPFYEAQTDVKLHLQFLVFRKKGTKSHASKNPCRFWSHVTGIWLLQYFQEITKGCKEWSVTDQGWGMGHTELTCLKT